MKAIVPYALMPATGTSRASSGAKNPPRERPTRNTSFAKTGKPTCEGVPDWPRYTPQGDQLMELGLKPQVRSHFRKPQLDAQEQAWREGIEEAKKSVEDNLRSLEESQLRRPDVGF